MNSVFEIRNISKAFGGLRAVSDVSLKVEAGRIVSVIGPNGAGKTTVFNCATGFYRPDSGSLIFEGTDITSMAPHEIAACGIARTFQNIRLFGEMSVLENVMTGRFCRTQGGSWGSMLRLPSIRDEEQQATRDARRLLEFVGLEKDADTWARNLPYGRQRRLEIARALATEPKVLLLDEPAAGMNPTETVAMIELIRKIRDTRVTVVLIEHDMKLVMDISDHVLVLDHGEMLAEGSPKEVKANPRVIEAYLGKEE